MGCTTCCIDTRLAVKRPAARAVHAGPRMLPGLLTPCQMVAPPAICPQGKEE